jgi:predicted transcriptional regulator YdeE
MSNRTRELRHRGTAWVGLKRLVVWPIALTVAGGTIQEQPARAGVVSEPLHACPDARYASEIKLFSIVPLGPTRVEHLPTLRLAGPAVELGRSAGGGTLPAIQRAWSRMLHDRATRRAEGLTYAVCYSLNAHSRFFYVPSVSMANLEYLPRGYSELRVPSQDYVVATYTGPASGIGNFRYTMTKVFWPSSQYHRIDAPNIEVYQDGYDPNSPAATMELWVAIEPITTSSPIR